VATAPPRIPEGRVPPHDLDAEQSVLGAILLDPQAITRVLDFLQAEDFYRENHRQIYRAALHLFEEGEPIDNITVASELQKLGVLDRIGGRAQLAVLQESVPTAANAEYYARIVKEKSYKRRLIEAGGKVAALGYDPAMEADQALNEAQASIYAIADDRIRTDFERLYDLLRPAMDRIDAQMASGSGVVGVPTGFLDLDRLTNGFKASDLVIVAGRPSMGKCCVQSTILDDPISGERTTIEEWVRQRKNVVLGMSETGHIRTAVVADWVDSGVQPCYRLRTRSGRSIEVTGHHPFMTALGWQPLHDIIVGDKIAVPRAVPCFGQKTLEFGLVRLLAYYIAEGGLTTRYPAFTNADTEIVVDFEQIIRDEFPSVKLRRHDITYYATPAERRLKGLNAVVEWLRPYGLLGKPSFEKRFPSDVWLWDRPTLAEFLRALMSCDGTIYSIGGYARIEFAVASRELAEDVHHALTRFGIVSKLWKKKHMCWRVEITEPASVDRFQAEIGWIGEKARRKFNRGLGERRSNVGHLPHGVWSLVRASASARGVDLITMARVAGVKHAQERGFNLHSARGITQQRLAAYASVLDDSRLRTLASPDLYWDEVVSIEPIGSQQVYDLTVPDGANFIAQDIIVHNTSWALNVALHAAVDHQVPVAIFSLEMSKEQLVERLLCAQAKIDSQRMHRGMLSEAEHERLAMALGPLGDAPIFIDESPSLDELTVLLKARQIKLRENIGMIVLDYLQLMQGRHRGDDSNRVQEVSQISRSLKALARELKVPVLAISQLSRAPEQRPDKRPILSDLRESGSLEQDADVVLFIFRPEYYKPEEKPGRAEIIIAKHRNGPTGMVELLFRRDQTLFYNLEARRPAPDEVAPQH
jgi:replicative DNA helicase